MSTDQQDSATAVRDWEPPSPPAAVVSVSCNDVHSFSKPVRDEITLIAGLGVAGDVHAGATVKHRGRVAADPTQPNLRQVHLIPAELHAEVRLDGYDVPAGGLGENVTTSGLDLLALPCGTILRFGSRPPAAGAASAAGAGDDAGALSGLPTGAGSHAGVVSGPSAGAEGDAGVVSGRPTGAGAVVAAAAGAVLDGPSTVAVAALVARIEADAAAGSAADPRPAVVITGLRNPCQQINGFRPGLLKQVLGRDAGGNLVRRAGIMGVVLRGGAVRPGDPIEVELPARPHLPLDRV